MKTDLKQVLINKIKKEHSVKISSVKNMTVVQLSLLIDNLNKIL